MNGHICFCLWRSQFWTLWHFTKKNTRGNIVRSVQEDWPCWKTLLCCVNCTAEIYWSNRFAALQMSSRKVSDPFLTIFLPHYIPSQFASVLAKSPDGCTPLVCVPLVLCVSFINSVLVRKARKIECDGTNWNNFTATQCYDHLLFQSLSQPIFWDRTLSQTTQGDTKGCL